MSTLNSYILMFVLVVLVASCLLCFMWTDYNEEFPSNTGSENITSGQNFHRDPNTGSEGTIFHVGE